MFNNFRSALGRLLFAPAIGLVVAALAVGPAWAQTEKKEPAKTDTKADKDAKDSAKDTAKDTSKDAKDSAKDTAKNKKDSAKDSAKTAKDAAQDTTKKTTDRAKDSAKDTTDRAKGSAKTQRDTAKDTRDSTRDTRRDTARDTARDTRDTARDTRDTRDARDARDSRDRDVDADVDVDRRDARDARDARDRRDVRDDRDVHDDRNLRDTRDARDTRDIDRRDVRTDVRDRRDTRVSRTRIDNFRAESITAGDLGVTFGRASDRGLVIQDLSRNAVLAGIGLRRDDVIVSVADHEVASDREFFRWMFAEDLRHERITIIVLRGGREVPLYVRPVTIIEELVLIQDDFDPLLQFGIVIDDRRPREVVVVRVLPGTPAFRAGFREGDVITTFRGQRLLGPQQFVQVLSTVEPGEVAFEVTRNRQVRELQVEMPRFERRVTARPDLDVDAPAIERREERRENRIERREERRDGVPVVQPVPPVVPARPPRPAVLPRNR